MYEKIPATNADFGRLYEMMTGQITTSVLNTAIQLKIFDTCVQPVSADEVASRLSLHPENTGHLLNALTALDLVVKEKGVYRNSQEADELLVSFRETYIGNALIQSVHRISDITENMTEIVRKGPPERQASEKPFRHEDRWAKAAATSYVRQAIESGKHAVRLVKTLTEFPDMRKMLDLGGGAGMIGMSIVASHPNMCGVLFDQPEVVKVAEKHFKDFGMEDRMRTIGGDYWEDPIGTGYDLVWTSFTLNFYRGRLSRIFNKIFHSLKNDGVFISFADGLTDERTKPGLMVLNMLPASLGGRDMCFDQGEIANEMLNAGFTSVQSRSIDTSYGPVDIDIARKTSLPYKKTT